MTVDPRRFCQLEIQVTDVPRALAFYDAAFGWRPVPAEIHEYTVLAVPDGCAFGIALVPRGSGGVKGGGLVPYFAVESPADIVQRAEAAGGRRRFGPASVAGYGVIWQVEDPDGNRFGLYEAQRAPTG